MALEIGTNCGFVTVAPTDDPNGITAYIIDARYRLMNVTLTENSTVIEMGFYTPDDTEEVDMQVGIYQDEGGTPTNLLHMAEGTKTTGAGWKKVDGLNFSLTAGTYWIAIQIDNTSSDTRIDAQTSIVGTNYYYDAGNFLPSTAGGSLVSDRALAIYALTGEAEGGGWQESLPVTTPSWSDEPTKTAGSGEVRKDKYRITKGGALFG